MTPDDFRKIALSMLDATEGAHMGHADFRVGGKIFATLPDETKGMVGLTPEMQKRFTSENPKVFEPVNGYWGLKGATFVNLAKANKATVRRAMMSAWQKRAAKP